MSPKNFITKVNFELTHPEEDLKKLDNLELTIISMRLGINGYNRQHSLSEISQEVAKKTSHSWAAERIKKILKKVRHVIVKKDVTNDQN